MDDTKVIAELADRKLASTTDLPFSVEEILQKLSTCATEAEQEEIWFYLDQMVPTLNEAQLARFRVEFADSITESSRRVDMALAGIAAKYGVRA